MTSRLSLILVSLLVAVWAPGCKKKGDAADALAPDASAAPTLADAAASQGLLADGKAEGKPKPKKKKAKKERKDVGRRNKDSVAPAGGATDGAASLAPSPEVRSDRVADGGGAVSVTRTAEDPTPKLESPAEAGPAEHPLPANPVVPPPPVKVAVAKLLSVADLNQHLALKGWISYGPIPGMDPSATYNSILYRKPGTAEFVALQVHDFDQYSQALEKWNELYATQPNAKELKDMFVSNLFFSYRNQVNALTFLEPDRAMVLIVSCHKDVCSDTALYNLASAIHARAF